MAVAENPIPLDRGYPQARSAPGFWRRYVFALDHKVIALQYLFTSLTFLLLGFLLVLVMRWQLAYPGQPVPLVGGLLGEARAPGGILVPETYNQFGAMHGTIMIFLAVVPLAVGAFGNYLVPLQIGASETAFPRLGRASYWAYLAAGLLMLASFFLPEGAPQSGWTSYPPLADIAPDGQTVWLLGMTGLILSSLLSSVNLIVTIVQLRAPGLGWMQLPFLVWAQLLTSLLLLLAFPALQAAGIFQLMDRLAGTSFFLPSGLSISGQPLEVSGGGNPILWQHLFWFLAHPEVYVLILPAFGIVSEVIATNIGKPLWGRRAMIYASVFLGFMSFTVWAHHMFLTDMGIGMSAFFQVTTMIVSIPSVVILTSLLLSLWGGSIRFTTPMLFALAFLPMFGLGGLTGLPLGLAPTDIHLHDTTYVLGHFHYIVAPGTLFALFAGIYYWFPRVTGRRMSDALGRLHFWPSLLFMNGIFLPMFIQGLAGVSRRLYDGGASYAHAQDVLWWNEVMSISAFLLALAQVPFLVNFFWSLRKGERVGSNPWEATTLEWTAAPPAPDIPSGVPYRDEVRPDTGLSNGRLGTWVFLAFELMLFGSLFSSYVLLRTGAPSWPRPGTLLEVWPAALGTVLIAATGLLLKAGRTRLAMATAAGFLALAGTALGMTLQAGHRPADSIFLALFFTLTGVHALHALGGLAVLARAGWTASPSRLRSVSLYWWFLLLTWVVLFVVFYLV